MEVDIEVGAGLDALTEPAPAAPSTTTAAVAARTELAKILSDPSHPHHAGLKRGDKAANDYIDNLYRRAYPTPDSATRVGYTASAPDAAKPLHEQDPSLSLEDRAAQTEVETELRHVLGDTYDVEMRDMRQGGLYLFATQETQALFEKLSPLITDLGPPAEVLGIRFLADLGRLAQQRRTS